MVEIEKKYNYHDGSVYEAQLFVHYELIPVTGKRTHEKHVFDAHYRRFFDGTGGDICITGKLHAATVFLDPPHIRGRRVGTFLMNEVVKWAKQWPSADVMPIRVKREQAGTSFEFHTERRNHFYERFGIVFVFDDEQTKVSGRSQAMKASQLQEVNSWKKNIAEQPASDYIFQLLRQLDIVNRERDDLAASNIRLREWHKKADENASKRGGKAYLYKALFWLSVALFLGALAKGLLSVQM